MLVTGALGTIGRPLVQELLSRGHAVRALDLSAPRRYHGERSKIEWCVGDLRSERVAHKATQGVEAIVHLAAVLPPRAYEIPERASAVNLGGSKTLIRASSANDALRTFVYTSSAAVYGITQQRPPPVSPDDRVVATDRYTADKLEVERFLRAALVESVVLRLAHVPILGMRMPHPAMFEIPLDNRMELLHAADAALAIANALEMPQAHGRTLLIGGGKSCQIRYRDYLSAALQAMGLPLPVDSLFAKHYHYSDWLDTSESQTLLRYQRFSFADIVAQITRRSRVLRPIAKALRPVLAPALTRLSPYNSKG